LSPAAQAFDQAHDGYLSRVLKRDAIAGKIGQSLLLFDVPQARCERLLLVGCGKQDELDERRYRQILSHAGKALIQSGAAEAVFGLTLADVGERDSDWKIRQVVETLESIDYRFDQLKSNAGNARPKLRQVILPVAGRKEVPGGEQAVYQAKAIAAGVTLAKNLGNMPANICTPTYLADQAKQLGKEYKGLKIKILDRAEMEKLGMGSLLAVAQGSEQPPKLIVMEYSNGAKKQSPTVLVGKGVTFDTGGISIKPGAAMDEMKFDMCGAAIVFGTLKACAELGLPLNVVGIVAAVENMPSGKAIKPGDVVTTMSGQTVEILNTDAEGRLILCDAISYSERYKPAAVIDIATLTGACVIALGKHPHGMFSNYQPLADALLTAGDQSCDRPWPLPLWEDYQEQLDSNFADMANIGGREGGAITAACFLSRFAKKLHWAHLDIAGTAWLSGKSKGATGRPVPLLTQYLLDQVTADG
jgi:leucyl aminopeptidase